MRLDHIQLAIPEGTEDASSDFQSLKNPRLLSRVAGHGSNLRRWKSTSAWRQDLPPPKKPTRHFACRNWMHWPINLPRRAILSDGTKTLRAGNGFSPMTPPEIA